MEDYNRVRLSIKLTNGKIFNFITEPNSHIKTSWVRDIDSQRIVVHNSNNASYSFPMVNIEYYGEGSLSIKETEPGIFEVSDYVK